MFVKDVCGRLSDPSDPQLKVNDISLHIFDGENISLMVMILIRMTSSTTKDSPFLPNKISQLQLGHPVSPCLMMNYHALVDLYSFNLFQQIHHPRL